MAGELAPQIRVNTIVLGVIDLGPVASAASRRMGEARPVARGAWIVGAGPQVPAYSARPLRPPEEVARGIAFLGSPAASYITGATLEISGGVSRFI